MKRPKRELVKGDYEFCVALEAYADWQAKVKKEQAYAIVRQDNQISELKSFRKYTVDLEQQIAELKEYVIHKPKCDLVGFTAKARHKRECTCGLNELLNKQ